MDALYDVIKSKKHRTWQNKIHEPILFKYLELCVDLRRSHIAKEGLYQYKLICQQVNIVSLEDVIRYFLKLAEDRADAARQESRDQVPIVDDLDQIQTPERYKTCVSYIVYNTPVRGLRNTLIPACLWTSSSHIMLSHLHYYCMPKEF